MALLWVEGFEGFGTSIGSSTSPNGVVGRKYTSVINENYMVIKAGRLGGYSLQFEANTCQFVLPPTLTTDDTLIAGTGFYNATNRMCYIFSFYDGVTRGMNLRWQDWGSELQLYRDNTLIATTSGLGLATDTWYYIEMKIKCHDTTGTYEVRVGGAVVLSDTGVDTKEGSNNYHDEVRFKPASYTDPRWDDFYLCDGSGAVNNDFLGNCKVVAVHPDGDDTSNWATVSPGPDHYAAVDEVVVDDDTSYVESNTANETDLYDYAAIANLGDIKGLQINTQCKETDATTYSIKIPIESGGNQYDDAGQVVGTTNWVVKSRLAELDPDTGNLWIEAGVNAAKFGIKVG